MCNMYTVQCTVYMLQIIVSGPEQYETNRNLCLTYNELFY